jgi:radical SAM superfamily enzyme YgiQ (UPF0313 family)
MSVVTIDPGYGERGLSSVVPAPIIAKNAAKTAFRPVSASHRLSGWFRVSLTGKGATETMLVRRSYNVLMIYPRFLAESFWNFAAACEIMGARYPAAPLGLITVAALLPPHWNIRLVNRNTEELAESDLAWADLVMTGGMLVQQPDTLEIIEMCHRRGKPVVVGGPDTTSSPHVYRSADFQVLGEAEDIMDQFIAAWEAGERKGVFEAEKFQVDVTKSPIPRFDLLKFDQYLYVGVQFSRGCPFMCEFCDIIELYGRKPRAKTNAQMLAELQALHDAGYRGHVDFVDDNLIGNKKAIKAFLPHLAAWLAERDYPFEFSTEASVNLADDDELLALMGKANFFGVFIGIESPDSDTLVAAQKKQNTRRSLVESIHKIYRAGMFVTAGFIVGFDTENGSMADGMIDFIDESSIPVCMVGLLYALPNTQLTRRLSKEGRLHENYDVLPEGVGDQCGAGLNFETMRPRRDVLLDYKHVLEAIYDPVAFCDRVTRLGRMLDRSRQQRGLPAGDPRRSRTGLDTLQRLINTMPEARELFWKTFTDCVSHNPMAVRHLMMMLALYLHLGPFSRSVVTKIDRQIAALDADEWIAPATKALPVAAMTA